MKANQGKSLRNGPKKQYFINWIKCAAYRLEFGHEKKCSCLAASNRYLYSDWRARRDSNARPLPSEGSTLSS